LPWRPNTVKKNTKTTKEMILGGRPPSKICQEQSAKKIRLTWRPAAKNHLLGSLATKKSEAQLELPKRQENVSPAKDITLLGG